MLQCQLCSEQGASHLRLGAINKHRGAGGVTKSDPAIAQVCVCVSKQAVVRVSGGVCGGQVSGQARLLSLIQQQLHKVCGCQKSIQWQGCQITASTGVHVAGIKNPIAREGIVRNRRGGLRNRHMHTRGVPAEWQQWQAS